MFWIRLVLVLAVAMMLGGCAAQASGAAQPVDTTEVTMPPSYRFDPPVIRVAAGATVSWRNADNFTHTVQVSGGSFPSLSLSPGQSGQISFEQPGTYDYICTLHAQDMRGQVIVVAR